MEEVLDLAQLAIAADERRFETLRLQRAAQAGDHTLRTPERSEPLLALELERARVLVDDRLLRRAAGGFADEDGPWLGGRLHARRRIDEIARDHALALGADRDGGFPGEDTSAGAKLGRADLVAERGDGSDQVERRADGSLRVVLGRGRRAPNGHHCIADELLDRAAVELDQASRCVEVAREELARILGVALPGRRREPDEVGEEDGDEPSLCRRRSARGRCGCCHGRCCSDRRPALATELLAARK